MSAALPLMPKATAIWLVENTALTFKQIADFCGMHELEIEALANDEVAPGMAGINPLASKQLTQEEIDRCSKDPEARLKLSKSTLPKPKSRTKGPRYTPVNKRGDKPNAVAWCIKEHPELSDAQISRLIGTTKDTINRIRERTHWNMANIKPHHPVLLGLCKTEELDTVIAKSSSKRAQMIAEGKIVEETKEEEVKISTKSFLPSDEDLKSIF